ncbi:hypothetical protein FIBSPDRAFT_946814 [Athelia psychrophila]|uniref:Uncharacterized protein n=1 Tax=Athelia psychrophila TaxID=1759441 RepID=A0A166SKK7_9AGAM|nr:hypothetical protein FIBSPDRAFT_946814 [Fibularhizoctonia sp. CBS 109695]
MSFTPGTDDIHGNTVFVNMQAGRPWNDEKLRRVPDTYVAALLRDYNGDPSRIADHGGVLKDDPIYSDLVLEDNKMIARWIPDGDGTVAIHLIGYMDQERVDADLAMGEKPVYYIGENEWPGDLLEADHPEAADQVSAGPSITEYDIFGGTSPLSSMSPDIKQEIREVSWHPTTPDPNDLTPYASSEPELQYPDLDEEVDQLDHASDSVEEAVWHKERQAQGRQMRAMSGAWEDKDNTWL